MLMKIHHESENHKRSYGHQIPVKSINAAVDLIGITDLLYPNIRIMQRVNFTHKIRQINHSFVSTSEALGNMNKSEGFILLLHFTVFSLDLAVTVNNILHSRHVNGNVSNTHLLVGRMMCYVSSETDPLRDEVDDFSNRLRLNDISYSAMGVCHIGRPLISTII
nr:uncharacterized protein LOC113395491 [Vanessa tameamea]